MLFSSLLRSPRPPWARTGRQTRQQAPRRRALRLTVEQLEDRLVLSNFTAATVSDLIADINAANLAGGSNTITLVSGNTFTLTAVDNTTDGATGLPMIAANDNLTVLGNGHPIARSTAAGTPAFRLLDVASGASLTLNNLKLQGGLALGSRVSAEGGAIYSQGTLDLNGVIVQNNIAQGNSSATAAGGGIYSSGSLTLEGSTKVLNNQALGGLGGSKFIGGGYAYGGGLDVAGGTATLINTTLYSNTAQGGKGGYFGRGGQAYGGGLFVAGGAVTLTSDTVSSNTAHGGLGAGGGNGRGGALYAAGGTITLRDDSVTGNTAQGARGEGVGGGLYINALATVSVDAFTLANVFNNTASTSNNNMYGLYPFVISGFPSPTTAGVSATFTVTVTDCSGNTLTGYTGMVHFSSSDPQAVMPGDYTFTAADQGVHTFTATLKTAGTQSITVSDKNAPDLTGTQTGITVNPARASSLVVTGFPSAAGVPFSITVTALDAYGNVATGYPGTVHFTSTDQAATLPADYRFTGADQGVHTFTGVIARTSGTQTITVTDLLFSSITGSDVFILP